MTTVICGGLRIDFLISATDEARVNQVGGNGIYAAVGARVWTPEVFLLAKAGENYPQEWLDNLSGQGIQTRYVRRVPGWQEMRTFYAYTDEKTRIDTDPAAHFARIGQPMPPELEGYVGSLVETRNLQSPLALRREDVADQLSGVDAVHIAPLQLRSHLELVQAFRRRGARQITVDPGEYPLTPETEPEIRAYSAAIDAFLPSELEVRLLLGTANLFEAAETFAAWGPPLVVVKRGPDGCLLYDAAARRFSAIPAYPARVVDVTGAGDAFGGAFTVGLRQTGDPLRAVLMGTVAASFTIEGYGARYALDAPPAEAERRLAALAPRVRPI